MSLKLSNSSNYPNSSLPNLSNLPQNHPDPQKKHVATQSFDRTVEELTTELRGRGDQQKMKTLEVRQGGHQVGWSFFLPAFEVS